MSVSAEQRSAVAPRRARVLVVDDEPIVLRSLRRSLSEHEVVTASNVDQGLALYQSRDFDIVFCDLMMPETNGLVFYARLCELGPEHARRLVLMTGGIFSDRLGCSMSELPHPCLLKPFTNDQLERCIDQALAEQGR